MPIAIGLMIMGTMTIMQVATAIRNGTAFEEVHLIQTAMMYGMSMLRAMRSLIIVKACSSHGRLHL